MSHYSIKSMLSNPLSLDPNIRRRSGFKSFMPALKNSQKNYRSITLELNMHLFIRTHASLNLKVNLFSSNRIDLREIQTQIGPVNTSKNVEKDLSIIMNPHQLLKSIIQG